MLYRARDVVLHSLRPIQDANRRVYKTLRAALGTSTAITERAIYFAFGERIVLEEGRPRRSPAVDRAGVVGEYFKTVS